MRDSDSTPLVITNNSCRILFAFVYYLFDCNESASLVCKLKNYLLAYYTNQQKYRAVSNVPYTCS